MINQSLGKVLENNTAKPDDIMLFNSKTTWAKCEDYIIDHGKIIPHGKFTTYQPFQEHTKLLTDFLKFASIISDLYSEYNIYFQKDRKSKTAKKRLEQIPNECLKEYRKFALNWGLLGIGFDRIASVDYREYDSDGCFYVGSRPQIFILRKNQIDDIFSDFNNNLAALNNIPQLFDSDGLPNSGRVSVDEWKKIYGGLGYSTYNENFDVLMGSDTFMKTADHIIGGINQEIEPYNINCFGIQVVKSNNNWDFQWKFQSLIQAISIIYANNLANKSGEKIGICPVCRKVFTLSKPTQIYCPNSSCKDTMAKRRQRANKKEKEGAINGNNSEA